MEIEFDTVYIGTLASHEIVFQQLLDIGIPNEKINDDFTLVWTKSRILFLECFAKLIHKKGINGSVAEAGVFQGEYAKEINRCFSDRTLYLFDTFNGFAEEDKKYEIKESHTGDIADYLKNTSKDLVMSKMRYPENVKIFEGIFPHSAHGIDDKFSYVNLDMDLYHPTVEGLRFFYPKMEIGGIITIHDFFSDAYPNVETAVFDFEKEYGEKLMIFPIGDDISVGIIRY